MASSQSTEEFKLWGGRFAGTTDPLMNIYNNCLSYDKTLYAHDIQGSQAYAKALHKAGLITEYERDQMVQGLDKVKEEWQAGIFVIKPVFDEDIHTANERRLQELTGPRISGKLHTGRSRNDQTTTDLRMWVRDTLISTERYLLDLIREIVSRASNEIDVIFPGYTQSQQALPIRWSHWLLSYGQMFLGDLQKLRQTRARVNRCPLGSGALSGNPFGVDREFLAKELGFEGVIPNSMVGVGDRDFVVEVLQWATMFMSHVSRLAEDMILYSTAEFKFLSLADDYSTGSSLMPQKKNSDSLELLRGKSGRVFGQMAGFMYTLKGLPSSYNKDLQEDKEPIFDCCSTVNDSIQIATGVIATLAIHPENMKVALSGSLMSKSCSKLAEANCLNNVSELDVDELREACGGLGEDIMEIFDYERIIERYGSIGGTAKNDVLLQIKEIDQCLQNLQN
ncbi:argininosuccinate lyase [Orbilia javanica]|uniref:Argininosuccinate lyase n=1 Tax=Orbilia javanica TaxID=47235 RepID=A0AAN8RC15_9PEZI